jgi:hypothetical protein
MDDVLEQVEDRMIGEGDTRFPVEALTRARSIGCAPAGLVLLVSPQGLIETIQVAPKVTEPNGPPEIVPPPNSPMTRLSGTFEWSETNAEPPPFHTAEATVGLSGRLDGTLAYGRSDWTHGPVPTARGWAVPLTTRTVSSCWVPRSRYTRSHHGAEPEENEPE